MNTNSNSYTIIYAAVMVVIVAFLLSFVHSTFSSRQDANVELDTKKQILYALNVRESADAAVDYNKYVKADMCSRLRLMARRSTSSLYLAQVFGAQFGDMWH